MSNTYIFTYGDGKTESRQCDDIAVEVGILESISAGILDVVKVAKNSKELQRLTIDRDHNDGTFDYYWDEIQNNTVVQAKGINCENTSVLLASLRHFQNAISAGENLSYLADIINLDSLDHRAIDPLCEAIQGMEVNSSWTVKNIVDNDGHLNIYVSHADGSEVMDVGEDIGSEPEWGCRLTTQKIEDDYNRRAICARKAQ